MGEGARGVNVVFELIENPLSDAMSSLLLEKDIFHIYQF